MRITAAMTRLTMGSIMESPAYIAGRMCMCHIFTDL